MTNVRISISTWQAEPPPQTGPARYQIKEIQQAQSGNPAVIVLLNDVGFVIDKQWQFAIYAWNRPGMTINAISAIWGDAKALANSVEGNGHNWLTNENVNKPAPNTDKVRTCARNIHTGIEIGNMLQVRAFDGHNPPPLKQGRLYPEDLADVNIDDYLYTPQTHPELFLVCNNFRTKPGNLTTISPWAHGGHYEWADALYGTVGEMFTFFPLVSRDPILSPLSNWIKLAPGEIASPYRRV